MADRASFLEGSRYLAKELGQQSWLDGPGEVPEGADFIVRSRTRRSQTYPMIRTPEGIAVHFGEGCEGEIFNGPTGCWHSKETSMVKTSMVKETALVRAEAILTPAPVEFTRGQLDLIKSQIAKGVTDDELQLFVATCRRTGLDPFLKQIYAIKRRAREAGQWVERMTIQVGIDGLRLIAQRTGAYGGEDPIEWLDSEGVWSEVWTGTGSYPIAAKCTIYRSDAAKPFVSIARWDSYVQTFDGKPNSMWEKMPDVMLGKCAESLALRRAFPAEMSGLAAALDSEYDPSVEATEQRQAEAPTPPLIERPATIEGEVVNHGDKAQETGASASSADSTQADSGAAINSANVPTSPASPPTNFSAITKELTALWADLKGSTGDEAWLAEVAEGGMLLADETRNAYGVFEPRRVKPDNAKDLLAYLRNKRGMPPSAPTDEPPADSVPPGEPGQAGLGAQH